MTGPGTTGDATPAGASRTIAGASGAARAGQRFYSSLSASSVGLELGIAVIVGVLVGMWLDDKLGTTPWMMIAWLGLGFAAGFRGVLRAVRRADREAAAEERAGG